MGLGKTFQLLSLMAWLVEHDPAIAPMLVVAPVSLLENWKEEVNKFLLPETLLILTAYGDDLAPLRVPRDAVDARLRTEDGLVRFLKPGWVGSAKVVLTTYETLRDLEFSFAAEYWSLMVCDEAQRIKNWEAKTSRVIQGDERDAKVLARNAQKWHKIMIWLGFRPFFIESFVRNVNFQMRRNLNYYLIGAIAWLGVALPVFLFWAFHLAGRATGAAPGAGEGWAIVAVYAVFALFSLWQINRRVVFEELNQMNWLGFDNLEFGKQLDEVIGKYAEDIGLWKGRFDR